MIRKSDAGQALVLAAVALVALVGVMGLAIDMGVLRYDKRLQQTAADAAALAGATNLSNTSDVTAPGAGGPGVIAGAIAAAKANGFADTGTYNGNGGLTPGSVGYVTVTVNNPPANGPHTGDIHYVEAIVSDVQPTYFSKILGVFSVNVVARAVASAPAGYDLGNNCLTTTQPPTASIEGVNINGNPTLNAPTCGIADNGNFNTKGNALTVNAGTFGVAGDWVNKGTKPGDITCGPTQPNCPVYPTTGYTDPLASKFNSTTNVPAISSPPQTCTISGSADANTGSTSCYYSTPDSTYYIKPDTYCSITIKGVASDKVVFETGDYVFEGMNAGCTTQSLNIPGNATISSQAGGVFFYFTGSSTINVTGTPLISLTAKSTGTYAGLLMWQDTADTNTNGPQLGGNDGSYYDGILYFPNDQLTFFGNACSGCSDAGYDIGYIVTGSIALSGNPTVNLLGAAAMPKGVSADAVPALVE